MVARATLLTRLETRQSQLATAEATYESLLEKQNKSYMFSGGEGSQQATKISLKEIKHEINTLIAEIEELEYRLYGGGIVRFSSSRLK